MKKVGGKGFAMTVIGIAAVVGIELFAIAHGMNGVMLTASVGTISLIVGGYIGWKVNKDPS